MSKLHPISEPKDAEADVIFVHGLGGDPFSTWQHNSGNEKDSWPYWLAAAIPEMAVHTLEYQASASHWRGEAMSLEDRATNVLSEFEARDIGARPLYFIGHSLGGLVIKEVLFQASDQAEGALLRRVVDQTRLVAFFATPHTGADIATWAMQLGPVFRSSAALLALRAHSPHLRRLDAWYRDQYDRWDTIAYFETVPANIGTFIPQLKRLFLRLPTRMMIVDPGAANPQSSERRREALGKRSHNDLQTHQPTIEGLRSC